MAEALPLNMPYVVTFPQALGTGIIVRTHDKVTQVTHARIASFIDDYEQVLSRFRTDSLVTAMGNAPHGGSFTFPDWTQDLFSLYDRLADATDGAIDPCIGEDLIRLGYGADMTFTVQSGASNRLGSIHSRPTWRADVQRRGTTLITRKPVHLDFGACGKGYLVDVIAHMLDAQWRQFDTSGSPNDLEVSETHGGNGSADQLESYVFINAGGDLRIRSARPITIALEDPENTDDAVGTATLSEGSLCASAPSRRRWGAMHHLLSAIDGLPVNAVSASWVYTNCADYPYPTAVADGLATALFVCSASRLAADFDFECALLHADRRASASASFPGSWFTTDPPSV